jgi:hypothetical protein
LPSSKQQSQVFDNGDGSRPQFSFGASFANYQLGSNPTVRGINVFGQERASFGDATSAKQAHPEQGAIAICHKPIVKQQLNFI